MRRWERELATHHGISYWWNCPFFLFLFLIALQSRLGFCHTSPWISHRYTYVPSILNLLPPSHPIRPHRLSQSTGLSFLCYTATSHELSVSHMFMYIFQCYSCNSSHPHPPLLCPFSRFSESESLLELPFHIPPRDYHTHFSQRPCLLELMFFM